MILMYSLVIPSTSLFVEATEEFIDTKETTLVLEHSLVSMSKWESKWKIPFLSETHKKTREQDIDYIRCMTITQNVDPNVYYAISNSDMEKISKYINDPQTATWFRKEDAKGPKRNSRQVTSELIYYWMTAYNIPMECQKWHLNRLMTLIRVCALESTPKQDMSLKEIYKQNTALNNARRAKYKTRG